MSENINISPIKPKKKKIPKYIIFRKSPSCASYNESFKTYKQFHPLLLTKKLKENLCLKPNIFKPQFSSFNSISNHNILQQYNKCSNKSKLEISLPKISKIILPPSINNTEKQSKKLVKKLKIHRNLSSLYHKIKNTISKKSRNILPITKDNKINNNINNNSKKDTINSQNSSCIHTMSMGNVDIFYKTHIDGFTQKKYPIQKHKYKKNSGFIDLNQLDQGNKISFKTILINEKGVYHYEFEKGGKMETIEERYHYIKKDKKEFKQFLAKYDIQKSLEKTQYNDFKSKFKNIYRPEPIINKNIYKDLYHMLIKKKEIKELKDIQ